MTATRRLIVRCCELTGRDEDSLIRDTDFDPKDLDPDRLDAAIAELRGLLHLSNEGFTNIKLLRAQPGTRTADIIADRKARRYALDIACSSASAMRDVDSLASYLLGVCRLKDEQLKNTKAKESCHRAGVVFVVNSEPALIWGYQPVYRAAIQEAHRTLGEPAEYHIAILTGRVAYVSGMERSVAQPDDVVYPDWSE